MTPALQALSLLLIKTGWVFEGLIQLNEIYGPLSNSGRKLGDDNLPFIGEF